MARIGILGGSFNPAHRGHRAISLAALEALGLDEIWWLVSPGNPLKQDKTMAPLRALLRRYPRCRFLWLMGADNLAQFHRWRDWREIARTVPIAVVTRPGYDDQALTAPAMGWLRRFVRPATEARHWTRWRLPSLVLLELPPDPTSATALRAADPDWHRSLMKSFHPLAVRDLVTRQLLFGRRPFARTHTRSA